MKAHVSRLLTKLDVSNRVGVAILVHDAAAATSPRTAVCSFVCRPARSGQY